MKGFQCNPTLDNSKPLYWIQASGGTQCGLKDENEASDECVGAPAGAQAVWYTEGPFQNPGWICSFAGENKPCSGSECIGDIIWTRH